MLLEKPLSNVDYAAIFTQGAQQILLLGETHRANFKKPHFTPIAQLIEPFLFSAENVDFMIEMLNDREYVVTDPEELEEIRGVVASDVNIPYNGHTKPTTIINLTRRLVQRFVIPQRRSTTPHEPEPLPNGNRVSWLDFGVIHDATSPGDQLLLALKELDMTKICNLVKPLCETEEIAWLAECGEEVDDAAAFEITGDAAKRAFVRACFNVLQTSKFFRKCFQGNARTVDPDIYVDVFMQALRQNEFVHEGVLLDVTPTDTVSSFYTDLYRFFMDVYTVCRLLKFKLDPTQFNNVVIYEGAYHAINVGRILTALGYQERLLSTPIEQVSLASEEEKERILRELREEEESEEEEETSAGDEATRAGGRRKKTKASRKKGARRKVKRLTRKN